MTIEFRWLSKVVFVAFSGATIALVGCSSSAPTVPAGLEQQLVNATSELDHENIASQYERQANLDAAAAKRHVGYAATYRKNTSPKSGVEAHETLAKHCENLARTYEQAANENLVMAKLHRRMARGVN